MKTIKEIKRLIIDVVNAIILLYFRLEMDLLSWGIADMTNIPVRGINNNEISIIVRINEKKK